MDKNIVLQLWWVISRNMHGSIPCHAHSWIPICFFWTHRKRVFSICEFCQIIFPSLCISRLEQYSGNTERTSNLLCWPNILLTSIILIAGVYLAVRTLATTVLIWLSSRAGLIVVLGLTSKRGIMSMKGLTSSPPWLGSLAFVLYESLGELLLSFVWKSEYSWQWRIIKHVSGQNICVIQISLGQVLRGWYEASWYI